MFILKLEIIGWIFVWDMTTIPFKPSFQALPPCQVHRSQRRNPTCNLWTSRVTWVPMGSPGYWWYGGRLKVDPCFKWRYIWYSIILYHIISFLIILYHIISHYITLYHNISYYILYKYVYIYIHIMQYNTWQGGSVRRKSTRLEAVWTLRVSRWGMDEKYSPYKPCWFPTKSSVSDKNCWRCPNVETHTHTFNLGRRWAQHALQIWQHTH